MRPDQRDAAYLLDMLQAAEKVERSPLRLMNDARFGQDVVLNSCNLVRVFAFSSWMNTLLSSSLRPFARFAPLR
jgi:hypothetical protein